MQKIRETAAKSRPFCISRLPILTRLWAPILAHTAEEINDLMKFDEESIHLSEFVKSGLIEDTTELKKNMETALALRKDVLKALEEAKDRRRSEKIQRSRSAHPCQ